MQLRFVSRLVPVVALLTLSGCNTNQVGESISGGFNTLTSGEYFSDGYLSNRADVCFAQRQQLAEHGSFFDKRVVGGAVAGAVTGGIIAAIRGDNVLAGAAIGGAVGLASGYLLKLQQDGLEADSILGRASGDVAAENAKIDKLLVSFRDLKTCRRSEAQAVQGRYNAKAVDLEGAKQEMAAIKLRYDEDVAKFRELADQVAQNTESYAAVYNEIAADNGTGELEVRSYKPGKKSYSVKRAPPKKATNSTAQGSLTVKKKSDVKKLQNECLTNVRKRDECIDEIREAEQESDDLGVDLA